MNKLNPAVDSMGYPIRDGTTSALGTTAPTSPSPFGGRYREIVIAVAFFLVFDLAVLVLNYAISYQISEDAVSINLAGRQRMLSQRTAKTLYAMESDLLARGQVRATDHDELRVATTLFHATLEGFKNGATVPGGNLQPIFLPAASSPKSKEILTQTDALWQPWYSSLQTLLAERPEAITRALLAQTTQAARDVNQKVLGLMNALTTDLEAAAAKRANTLRWVQAGGILLALLNFAFILFKFIHRMRTADAVVEAAQRENRDILATVKEGLFLLTPDMRMGTQLSTSTSALFGRPVKSGESLKAILEPMISSQALEDATSYIDLLFSPHVKESLMADINPLVQLETQIIDRLGRTKTRQLAFRFKRVQGVDGKVAQLLVTVQDVSESVQLKQRIAEERERSQREVGLLTTAAGLDPVALVSFVERSEGALLTLNDKLRGLSNLTDSGKFHASLESAKRDIHRFKSDSNSLGLNLLCSVAHQLESLLKTLEDQPEQLSNVLLSTPVHLEGLLTRLKSLKQLMKSQMRWASEAQNSAPKVLDQLNELAQRAAKDQGKRVVVAADIEALQELGIETQAALLSIMNQLVRNAVTHGIEPPALRAAAHKPADGQLALSLEHCSAQEWLLRVHDDGAGMSLKRVKQRLLSMAWCTPEQLSQMSDSQIMASIFRPGFSTTERLSEYAGRGVGLDVVLAQVNQLGGRVQVSSQQGQGTTFRVRFPV